MKHLIDQNLKHVETFRRHSDASWKYASYARMETDVLCVEVLTEVPGTVAFGDIFV